MNKDTESGFSIIEVVIGIVVFSIIIGVVSTAIIGIGAINDYSEDRMIVNSKIESKLEEIRNEGYPALVDTGGTPIDFTSELPSEIASPRSAEIEITSVTTTSKKVILTITYQEGKGQRSTSVSSIISKFGLSQ